MLNIVINLKLKKMEELKFYIHCICIGIFVGVLVPTLWFTIKEGVKFVIESIMDSLELVLLHVLAFLCLLVIIFI